MNKNSECSVLCTDKVWKGDMSKEADYRIQHEYFVHLIMDNLPCATRFELPDTLEVQYEPGYRLGFAKDGKSYLNNHLKFSLRYHKDIENNLYRVVGFLIETQSLDSSSVKINGENIFQFPISSPPPAPIQKCARGCMIEFKSRKEELT